MGARSGRPGPPSAPPVRDLLTSPCSRTALPKKTCIPVRLAERSMKKATRPSSRIRVLVVEDEALSRHALCQVLHRCGFFSAGASDGSQALEMVKFFRPQVIIMDLRMPKLDGFEATRRLKADEATAG